MSFLWSLPSLALYTLGCKLNQLESESIAGAFRHAGFRVLPWGAEGVVEQNSGGPDILLVNTCTVTSKAEQKARRIIRKALRDHPQALLIVTGCYAQVEQERLGALETEVRGTVPDASRLFVVSGDQKSMLLDLPRMLSELPDGVAGWRADPAAVLSTLLCPRTAAQTTRPPSPSITQPQERFRFIPGDFSFHSRAFLKIQDGCDKHCTYCRVRLARGPSVSLEAPQVLSALQALEARGYGEAVLTGVNISRYCSGQAPGELDLAGLLGYLLEGTEHIRLRLSSLEPGPELAVMKRDFFTVLAHPRIRPHVHLSVQSGSPRILEKMGRPYTPQDIEGWVRRFRSVKDDPFVAGDIITGFPGETEDAFEETYELCRRIGFTWIHAFPYSPRPGTEAYLFKEPVSEREAVARVERLLGLARQGRRSYIEGWVGRTVEAVVEAYKPEAAGTAAGVSENYLKLLITLPQGVAPSPGSLVRCRIRSLPDDADKNPRFDATAEWLV
ncbi:MAG: tRNA (N(6)-L-threonylcarbamoyladenosine(37)-C(2))-methylthiotransferase MtaB [Treponema sp.]|nr:tRNA (N(6)-L-threonylcarbamoyladenosine(37)-C(2))-methylthiotransferase MtaB [Treponema sp.]